MRESTSPPRGDGTQNGSTSPGQSSLSDAELTLSPSRGGKKCVTNGNNSLSPTPNNNNNEELPPNNGNVINGGRRSPKQMRNTATSPTCRTSSRNSEFGERFSIAFGVILVSLTPFIITNFYFSFRLIQSIALSPAPQEQSEWLRCQIRWE